MTGIGKRKPLVGVSRCLLGEPVRYDGKSRPSRVVLKQLAEIFELVPVCPEVEAGLSVPRPPVQLTGSIDKPRLTGRDDPALDITDIMLAYCRQKPAELEHLSGFIFKSRSPSCGLNSTPVYINGLCVTENSRGIFARAIGQKLPAIAVIEDSDLENPEMLSSFIQAIKHMEKI